MYTPSNSLDPRIQHTVILRWTSDRAWIESEKNKELAKKLRNIADNIEEFLDVSDIDCLFEIANTLDGRS